MTESRFRAVKAYKNETFLASPEARAMICNWNERVTPHLDPLRFVHRWTDVA